MLWKRPESVPVGQVWSTFTGTDENGKPLQFIIRDVEEKDKKQFIDLMEKHFIRDEPLCKILGIPSDPVSITSIRSNWDHLLSQRASVVCSTGDGRMAGFNVLYVASSDDEEEDLEQFKGEPCKKLFKTLGRAENLVDVFSHYGVEHCLADSGLCVLPEFRGRGVGARLLRAREAICRAFGLQAVRTVFTAVPSQILAVKCGYELLAEMPFAAMLEQGIDLSGCECETAQLMGIKYRFDK